MSGYATLSTAARNAAANAVVDLVDAGAGSGKLILLDSSNVVLAKIVLSKPAFGDAVAGVASSLGDPHEIGALAAGTIDKCQVTDSDENVVYSGPAGTTGSGNPFEFDVLSVVAVGQVIRATTVVYTAPADHV